MCLAIACFFRRVLGYWLFNFEIEVEYVGKWLVFGAWLLVVSEI